MDIYRKELNEIYQRQHLDKETLPGTTLYEIANMTKSLVTLTGMCAVITDIAHDTSIFVCGNIANLFNLPEAELRTRLLDSSDEDFLYTRMHPEDLVDLRMLEYEFFKKIDATPTYEKVKYKASAEIRISDGKGGWVPITKSTQVVTLSPKGKMWLILCCYDLSDQTYTHTDTNPRISCCSTGYIQHLPLQNKRCKILTDREKQILKLIKNGLLSKEIADRLNIRINTVNRHRQNILEKLSVDNSMEAVNAAIAMKLI